MDQISTDLRYDWTTEEVEALFARPFNDLLFEARVHHLRYFNANEIQISTLKSIKTGSCPEDCKYCPQSAHYNTGLEKEPLLDTNDVLEAAKQAKASGASRFCMGAAWRNPHDRDMPQLTKMISDVKALGLETCGTFGMLSENQAEKLQGAGLDYYNHNLDSSPEFYETIISTRKYQDRLDTLANVRQAGMKVCCGGIIGMGEEIKDRAKMLQILATMDPHPESVPINQLIRIEGTPLEANQDLDPFDFVRTIAVARIIMPSSHVRLSAGREEMSDEMQALCFFAGANSIFYGEKLLTAKNPEAHDDLKLMGRLGLKPESNDANAEQNCNSTATADLVVEQGQAGGCGSSKAGCGGGCATTASA